MENFWEYLQNLTDAKSILSNGGFVVLLIVVYAETGLFLGFFLPGDYLLFLAGILTAAGIIHVPIYVLVPSLIVSAVLGNYTGYWFGYRTGPVLSNRKDSFFFKKRYITVAEEFYAKYGGMALILGRFFPIVRTFAPIFAGIVKLDIKKFSLYNIVGGIAWVTTLTLAGYFLGRRFPELKDYMQYVILALIIITTIPLIIAFVKRRYTQSKEE
jgi:membrane-associated protein